jgi:hypothetical protein
VRAHELVQAPVPEHAVALVVDVQAVRRARSLAIQQHAERNRRSRARRQHQMRVACVEPERDAPTGLVEHDLLALDRPLAGQGPLVGAQRFRELVGVAFVECGTAG